MYLHVKNIKLSNSLKSTVEIVMLKAEEELNVGESHLNHLGTHCQNSRPDTSVSIPVPVGTEILDQEQSI